MSDSLTSVVALILVTFKRLFADEAIPLAGNIAFRLIFSIFPFLIFLTALAGFFGSMALAESVVNFLLSVAPEQLVRPVTNEVRAILTQPRSGLLSLSALITIWSATAGVDSVRVGLNRAYDLKDTRSAWFLLVQNVLFVIGAAFLLLAVALMLVGYPLAINYFPNRLAGWASFDHVRYPLAILILVGGVYLAHRILPARALSARDVFPGVMVTVIVWTILSTVFSYYLVHFNSFASTYASLSGLFAAMFFIYQAALILIFGGELNRVIMLLRMGKASV